MTARRTPLPPHIALGAAGENAAALYLQNLGWRILHTNWRPRGTERGLELDIIAKDGTALVFAEVKTRSHNAGAASVPARAGLTPAKKRRLARAASLYLTDNNLWETPCRFDLICLEAWPDGQRTLEHHTHVIEIGHSLDSRNASWQPW